MLGLNCWHYLQMPICLKDNEVYLDLPFLCALQFQENGTIMPENGLQQADGIHCIGKRCVDVAMPRIGLLQ